MGNPIPVFTFVFAAYAATSEPSASRSGASVGEEQRGLDPFLTAWRSRAARGATMFAKVGLLAEATPADLKLATRAVGEIYEDVWLGDIVETRLGFIGAALPGERLPARMRPGQRVRFNLINVLDWRLGAGARAAASPYWPLAKLHPREMLAQLSESVRK